jgi:hypothetical protein
MVGADGLNQFDISSAAHTRHLGTERLGDLHRERPDPTGRTVDQNVALPGLAPCHAAPAER